MIGVFIIGWQVLHQSTSSSPVQETDRGGFVVDIGGQEAAVEIREQVDLLSTVGGRRQDTRESASYCAGGVISDHDRVDKYRQKIILTVCCIVPEHRSGVVIAEGRA